MATALTLILLASVLAVPALWFGSEALRKPMDGAARNAAPGRFAGLSQGTTHFRWHSDANGPVVVLIHGLSTPSFCWNALIPTLGKMGFRVLSYDLFGRGYSDRPQGEQDRAFFVTQLDELLDFQGITRPVTLIGNSMGGAIAATYAEARPERVARLILIVPAGLRVQPARFIGQVGRWPVLGDWLWRVFGGHWLRRNAARAEQGSVIPDIGARMAREAGYRGFLRSVLSSHRHMLAEDLTPTFRSLGTAAMPTLVLWGETDQTIPASNIGLMTAAHRSALQIVLPGAGHGMIHTHPREVLAEIAGFLKAEA